MVSLEGQEKDGQLVKGPLERLFTGNATAKMLDFLIGMQEFDYSESEIARYSRVSIRHAIQVMSKLEELGLIRRTRVSGRSKMYKLNKDNKTGALLEKWALSLAQLENSKIISTQDEDDSNKKESRYDVNEERKEAEEDKLIA